MSARMEQHTLRVPGWPDPGVLWDSANEALERGAWDTLRGRNAAAADGNMVEVTDPNGLLVDATDALRLCAMRYQSGKPLRLDGKGILSLRGLLEDYAQAVSVLSERAVARCVRLTERRISVIRNGETRPHDVVLVSPC